MTAGREKTTATVNHHFSKIAFTIVEYYVNVNDATTVNFFMSEVLTNTRKYMHISNKKSTVCNIIYRIAIESCSDYKNKLIRHDFVKLYCIVCL